LNRIIVFLEPFGLIRQESDRLQKVRKGQEEKNSCRFLGTQTAFLR